MESATLKRLLLKEVALITTLVFVGLALLPLVIYLVGENVFGPYGDAGYGEFNRTLGDKIRSWDLVAWFLVLSPYLSWQCLRLIGYAWRMSGRQAQVPARPAKNSPKV